jgi:hypothetical protein
MEIEWRITEPAIGGVTTRPVILSEAKDRVPSKAVHTP